MKRSTNDRNRARALRISVCVALVGLGLVAPALPASAAITVEIVDGGDGFINAAEVASGVVVRGKTDPEWDVAVRVDDADPATAPVVKVVEADLNGDYTTGPLDLSSLADGTITATAQQVAIVKAKVTPVEGGPSVTVDVMPPFAEATDTTVKDTKLPTVQLSVEHGEDGFLNAAEIAAGSVVSGSTEAKASVSLTVRRLGSPAPVITRSLVADANGAFATEALDLSIFPDGTLRFSASATDQAGNAASTRLDVVKDVVPPTATVAFVDPNLDGKLDPAEIHTVVVQGTAPAGTVHLVVDDADPATLAHVLDIQVSSPWSTPPLDLSNLQDGVITATATPTDLAGNVGPPATASILKQAGPPPLPPGVEILDNPPSHPHDDPAGTHDGFIDEYANCDETDGVEDTSIDDPAKCDNPEAGTALGVRVDLAGPDPNEVFLVSVTVDDADPSTPPVVAGPRALAPASSPQTRTFRLDVRGLRDGGITAVATVRRNLESFGFPPGSYAISQQSDTSVLDLHNPFTVMGTLSGTVFVSVGGRASNISFTGSTKDLPPNANIQFVVIKGRSDRGASFIRTATLAKPNAVETSWTLSGITLDEGTWTISALGQDDAGNFEPVRPASGQDPGNTITIMVV